MLDYTANNSMVQVATQLGPFWLNTGVVFTSSGAVFTRGLFDLGPLSLVSVLPSLRGALFGFLWVFLWTACTSSTSLGDAFMDFSWIFAILREREMFTVLFSIRSSSLSRRSFVDWSLIPSTSLSRMSSSVRVPNWQDDASFQMRFTNSSTVSSAFCEHMLNTQSP